MRVASFVGISLPVILIAGAATASDNQVASPSWFTPLISAVPVQEVGLPETIRTDGREFLVVPWRAESSFWILDAETGDRRKVTAAAPEDLSHVSIRSVDRLGKGRLVASASWVEQRISRSGLFFMDDDGHVDRYVGYGFSIRSIVVGPTKEWIVGAIQEPQDPTSTEIDRPTNRGMAVFDSDGELKHMSSGALGNMMGSFEESVRTHPLRRVFLMRDTVVLTYPFLRKKGSAPVAWIEARGAVATKKLMKSSIGREVGTGTLAPLHFPRLGEEHFRGAKPIGIVPVVSEGRSAFLAAWLTRGGGEPEDPEPTAPRRDRGRLLLTLYDAEGKDAKEVGEVEDGTRIGELTSSPDGTAYAVTFRDISKEWSISRVDF